MIDQGKRNVLGVLVDAIDYEAASAKVLAAARERRPLALTALAVHGVMTGVQDPAHGARLNGFDVVTPDGQPVRWALNLLHGAGLADRVYGPTLTLRVLEGCADEGLPIYLYGSTPETLDRLLPSLQATFPTLKIAGAEASKFRASHSGEAAADRRADPILRRPVGARRPRLPPAGDLRLRDAAVARPAAHGRGSRVRLPRRTAAPAAGVDATPRPGVAVAARARAPPAMAAVRAAEPGLPGSAVGPEDPTVASPRTRSRQRPAGVVPRLTGLTEKADSREGGLTRRRCAQSRRAEPGWRRRRELQRRPRGTPAPPSRRARPPTRTPARGPCRTSPGRRC